MRYPHAAVGGDTDELAGVIVDDPYRWLEDGTDDEVRLWQKRQNELAAAHVHAWPGYERMRDLVDEQLSARVAGIPIAAGGRWFRQVAGAGSHSSVLVAEEPFGDGDVVFDTHDVTDPAGSHLSWISPSPDGRTLAVGICVDGSEQNTIHLIDVESGARLPAPPQRLMDSWTGGAVWLADSSGFYATVLAGAATNVEQYVVFHSLATGKTAPLAVPWTTDRDYRMVVLSRDGRRLVAVERAMNPIPVAVAEIDDPASPIWMPFVTGTTASLAGHLDGDRYIAVTDHEAPRGRVVAIELSRPLPEDWITLVPESSAVIRSVTAVAERLYLTEFRDTYSSVRVTSSSGDELAAVELPGQGAVAEAPFPFMGMVRRGHPDEFLFVHSSLISSPGVYRHLPDAPAVEVLNAPAITLQGVVVEDRWARSTDGTSVPFHVVRSSTTAGPMPTLLYGYGGFNAPLVPQFPGAMAAFVAAGGTLVHAHLRGGAEFGRQWWDAGRLKNKQNSFLDVYAIAEQLIADGVTTPDQLAVTGGSNGGLMAAVALTQRPELWAAVIPRVPLLDLVGACRDPYGRLGVSLEYADVADAEEVRRMLGFSPYHLVQRQAYPAVMLDAGDTDPRCPPWHARKLAARLQAAQLGTDPILLRVWENAGHGGATGKEVATDQNAAWLSFAALHTGLEIAP